MYQRVYADKLTTADKAVSLVPEGAIVIHGMAVGEPPALLAALAARLRSGGLGSISLYSMFPCIHSKNTVLSPDLSDQVQANTWFVSPSDRQKVRVGLSYFIPNEFHQVPRFIRENMDTDVVLTTVSPMDKSGFFTFGAINDYISTAARHTRKLIVEVNPRMPRVFGDSLLHVSEVDAIVENEVPMLEVPTAPSKPRAAKIARAIAEMVPDGATIQLGFGAIPGQVCAFLESRKDLGIHSELFCEGMVDLIEKGVVTGRKKTINPRKHVFTNALGNRRVYDFIHDNPSCEAHPVSYVNDPAVVAQNDNLISINATLEVDLTGQCNSEYLGGSQFSGTGGQLDFVRGAYRSKGGRSIIAFYSTANDDAISRVVPRLGSGAVVTTPRMDVQWLMTEHGAVNLKGKSTRDRALGIISIAHPKFRDDLLKEAENMYLL